MATTTNPTATGVMSWAAFEQLPDDGMHHEIIEGELVSLPPPKFGHSEIAHRILRALDSSRQSGFSAYVEAGYKLSHDPPTWVQPDVSVLSKSRIDQTDPDGYFLGAPELAVEVISPSESANDVVAKVQLLLKHGGRVVWVVYPKRKTVEAKRADGTSITLGVADTLTLPELLPGWELPVVKLFE